MCAESTTLVLPLRRLFMLHDTACGDYVAIVAHNRHTISVALKQ